MLESPAVNAGGLVTFRITSNGTAIPDTVQVVSITVASSVSGFSLAEISLFDGSAVDQSFYWCDSDLFNPGTEIGIGVGYDGQEKTIFNGLAAQLEVRISADMPSLLIVHCRENSVAAKPGSNAGSSPGPADLKVVFGESMFAFDGRFDQGARGSVKFQGSAKATVGGVIELGGLGARFSGDFPIHSVRHRIEEGDWSTEVGFGTTADRPTPADD